MTVQTVSTYVTNGIRTSGVVLSPKGVSGTAHVLRGVVALGTTALTTIGNTVSLVELPWEAQLMGIKIRTDQLDSGSGLVWELGLQSLDKTQLVYTVLQAGCYITGVTNGQSALYTGSPSSGGDFLLNATRTLALFNNRVLDDANANTTGAVPSTGTVPILTLQVTTAAVTGVAGNLFFEVSYLV